MGHDTLSRREILRMMGVGALYPPPSLFHFRFQHSTELCPRPSTLLFIAADEYSSSKIDGEAAPYFTIKDTTILERMVDAASGSRLVDRIVVVGDKERIETTLKRKFPSERVTVQQEHPTFVDDLVIGLCQYVRDMYGIETPEEQKWKNIDPDGLRTLREDQRLSKLRYAILPANTPLITTDEIDLLLTSASTPGITVGLTGEGALQNAFNELERLGETDKYSIFSRDFLKFRRGEEMIVAEPNHFYAGDISTLDKEFLTIVRELLLLAKNPLKGLRRIAGNGFSLLRPYRNQRATETAEATGTDYKSAKHEMRSYTTAVRNLWNAIDESRNQTAENARNNGAVNIHSLQETVLKLSQIPVNPSISNIWSLLIEVDSKEKASYLSEHWGYWRRAQDVLYERNGTNVLISS